MISIMYLNHYNIF